MIPKNKVVLQLVVENSVAKTFKDVCKASRYKTGEFFTLMFSDFLSQLQAQLKQTKNDSKKKGKQA